MRLTSAARVERSTRVPSTRTLPSSGVARPRISRRTVDLPDPLEPRRTWVWPAATSIDTPSSAPGSPNRFVTSRSAITLALSPGRSALGDHLEQRPVRAEGRDAADDRGARVAALGETCERLAGPLGRHAEEEAARG